MAFRIKFLHRDNRYLILLSLMASVTLPAFSLLIAGDDISDLIFATCFTGIVLAGFIWTVSESKIQRIIGTPLGLLALVGLWIKTILTDDTTLEVADTVLSLCFFNFLAFTLLRNIFRSKEVNLGIIFGSVAGYVTIGILGGLWMNLGPIAAVFLSSRNGQAEQLRLFLFQFRDHDHCGLWRYFASKSAG